MKKRLWTAMGVMFFATMLPLGAAAQGRLPNLRALRTQQAPFVWRATNVTVESNAEEARHVPGRYEETWIIRATVAIHAGTVEAVEIAEPHRLLEVQRRAHNISVVVEVRVPALCPAQGPARTYVTLVVRTLRPQRTWNVPIDQACIIGHLAREIEHVVPSVVHDSIAVRNLAAEIRRYVPARSSLIDHIQRFATVIRNHRGTYRPDPRLYGLDRHPDELYGLLPDETLRYGGDCEDWALLVAGVLQRLGFPAVTQLSPQHAWVTVGETIVDFTTDVAGLPSPLLRERVSTVW